MTKVVINNCFGGFELSDKAMQRYCELKGIKVYPEDRDGFMVFWLSPPTGDENEDVDRDTINNWNLNRDDPSLVQVVEELGEDANGDFAALGIVDIPPGTKYRIVEYDGNESIETADDINWKTA